MAVHGATAGQLEGSDTDRRIRVLAWNLAHGRGDAESGWFRNWRGGSDEERVARLGRMAMLLREADADVVVLNEVDFDAGWSDGLNQAEVLARSAGYEVRVEQRNYDLQLPFTRYAFGNAVLTRLPLRDAEWMELPVHSRLEDLALGAKAASVVRLETTHGPLSVVAVHLEPRGPETRLAAVRTVQRLRSGERAPLILAGDFNAAPPGWPGSGSRTVLGELLDLGWRSPRADRAPEPEEWTYPSSDPERSIDWILVEPPLQVTEARVLAGGGDLSDHAPVLAVIEVPEPD